MALYGIQAEFAALAALPARNIPEEAMEALASVGLCGFGDRGYTTVGYVVEANTLDDANTEGLRLAQAYAEAMTLPAQPAAFTVRRLPAASLPGRPASVRQRVPEESE
jgi:hypothetical protein